MSLINQSTTFILHFRKKTYPLFYTSILLSILIMVIVTSFNFTSNWDSSGEHDFDSKLTDNLASHEIKALAFQQQKLQLNNQAPAATSDFSLTHLQHTPYMEGKPAWLAQNPMAYVKAYFYDDGPLIVPTNPNIGWQFKIQPIRLILDGYTNILPRQQETEITIIGDKIEYQRGLVTEWFVNSQYGIEHGLTIKDNQIFHGLKFLTAAVEISGENPTQGQLVDDQNLKVNSIRNIGTLYYSKLSVFDNNGHKLPAKFNLNNVSNKTLIEIQIDISSAHFPITIDPVLSTNWETLGNLKYGESFGHRVINVGDVTGNGFDDALVSDALAESNPNDIQTVDRGTVYLFEGSATGLGVSPAWSYTETQLNSSGTTGAQFGYSIAAAGDLNQDGVNDFIVGATTYSTSTVNYIGRVYIFLGNKTTGIPSNPPYTVEAEVGAAGTNFGTSVAAADVNGDGRPDVVIGHPEYDNPNDPQFMNQGRVLVYLNTNNDPSVWFDPTKQQPWSFSVTGDASGFGNSVANAGDVDDDGYEDIIVGSPGYNHIDPINSTNNISHVGAAFIFYGGTGGISNRPFWKVEANQQDAWLGMRVAGVGDINGDLIDDVMASAVGWSENAHAEGKAFLYLGAKSTGPSTTESWSYLGGSLSANLNPIAGAGDINGDGFGDIIIGLQGYSNTASLEGRILVFEGNNTGLSSMPVLDRSTGVASGQIGFSVGGGGDFNGDGYSDVIAGAVGINSVGGAYAFYGAGNSDLEILVSDSVDPVAPLTDYTYTLKITNYGPDPAKRVVVEDSLPNTTIIKSVSADAMWSCSESSLTVTCTTDNIIANSPTSTINIVVQYPTTTASMTNSATINANIADPNIVNNTANETTQINTPPIASDQSITTDEDVTYDSSQANQTLASSDPDSDPLTFTLKSPPNHGIAALQSDGTFSYQPNSNFNGTDSFSYEASDGIATVTASVNITVSAVNDAPIATSIQKITNEDVALTSVLTATDIDTAQDLLSYTLGQGPTNGSVTISTNGDYTYTPSANFNGNDSFTFIVSDNGTPNQTDVGTISVTILPINDPPTVFNQTFTTQEETVLSAQLIATDAETSSSQLFFRLSPQSNTNKGVVSLSPDGNFTYQPFLNMVGEDRFDFEVVDNANPALSSVASAIITITNVNDPPVALNGSINVIQNQKWGAFLIGTDVDSNNLEYILNTPPSKGTVEIYDASIGGYTYTPNTDETGADSFTFKIFDGTSYSDSASPGKINVYINAAGSGNVDPSSPTLIAPENDLNDVDASDVKFLWQAAVDPDSDILNYQIAICMDDPNATCTPTAVNKNVALITSSTVKAISGPGAGLFLFGLLGIQRRRKWYKQLLLAGIVISLAACSNAAEESVENDGFKPGTPELMSYQVNNLTAGKTYYWKVIVTDDSNGQSESETRSFITKP